MALPSGGWHILQHFSHARTGCPVFPQTVEDLNCTKDSISNDAIDRNTLCDRLFRLVHVDVRRQRTVDPRVSSSQKALVTAHRVMVAIRCRIYRERIHLGDKDLIGSVSLHVCTHIVLTNRDINTYQHAYLDIQVSVLYPIRVIDARLGSESMSRRSAIPSHLSFARGVLGFAFTREREERKWNGHGRSQRFLSIYTGQGSNPSNFGLGTGDWGWAKIWTSPIFSRLKQLACVVKFRLHQGLIS